MSTLPNNKNFSYSHIKVIGFDLDQTLYPKSSEVDEAIQAYIYQKIATHKKIEIEEGARLFKNLYKDGDGLSGRRTLETLEIPGADTIIQEALEKADIASILKPNLEINSLLNQLKEKYPLLDIISGSSTKDIKKKLDKLQINSGLFNNLIGGDCGSKSDLSAFKLWLANYPELPSSAFLYIGDRLSTDYLAPKELGIKAILINTKNRYEADIDCLQINYFTQLGDYLL